jgi:outer membrane protein OmpA-like peptidoglycan-associated protein
MRALALLALCLPSAALAGNPYDTYASSIGGVAIDGVVELPLQGGAYGDELPYILVKWDQESSDRALFLLDMGSDEIFVARDFAEERGDGVKVFNKDFFGSLGKKADEAAYKLGGKFELTHIDELYLGDGLVLSDIDAKIGGFESSPLAPGKAPLGTVVGSIGIGALGIPAALLVSEGIVRFAPADQGQAILDAVGGTVLAFESAPATKAKSWSGKELLDGYYMILDGQVAGQDLKLTLDTSSFASRVRNAVELGEVPSAPAGDMDMVYVPAALGAQPLEGDWAVRMDTSTLDYPGGVQVTLAYGFLNTFDLAVDPASSQLAIRPADAQQRAWPIQGFIDQKARELEPAEPAEGEEPAEKTEEDLKAEQEERAVTLIKKGQFHLVAAQVDEAIASMEEATGLHADPCEHWLELSKAYGAAHRFDDAAVAAQKGMDRYLAWASLSAEEREEIEEMDDEEREASGVQPQNLDACFQAPGTVAYFQLVAGQNAEAIATFDAHADLHPNIGLVTGIAYLLEGDAEAAQGPLRQALNMGARAIGEHQDLLSGVRIAMAELYGRQGDFDSALANWEHERMYLAADPFAVEQYAGLIRQRDGDAAVVPALEALAANYPENPIVRTVLAKELATAGQADAAKAAFAEAEALFAHELLLHPNLARGYGAKAWFLVQLEDWAGAKTVATKALELNPTSEYAHWSLMKVAEVDRKLPVALKHYKLAKSHGMAHWVFASLDKPKLVFNVKSIKITETGLDIPEKVFFETGSAVIDQRSFQLLDGIAQVLTDHPELLKVSVEGHTDSDGDDKANKTLSQERADAVVAYLVEKGVEAERLAAKGWGEEKPLGSNDTDEGKAANRRVEFLIVKKAK